MFGFVSTMMAAKSGFDPSTPLGTFVVEQGGYFIGTILDGGQTFALFLAEKAAGQRILAWKTSSTTTAGTSSMTNGLANSNAMNNATHPAAFFCRGLSIGGLIDWYLPAMDELNVIYTNRTTIVGSDAIDIDVNLCWSSSEHSAANAKVQRFSDGAQGSSGKGDGCRVRAVRRLAI